MDPTSKSNPRQHEPVGYEIGTGGPRTLRFSVRPPRPKWLGGVRGQARFEEHAGNVNSSEIGSMVTVPSKSEVLSGNCIPESTKEKPPKDSDADKEESLRLLREYYLKHPPVNSLREAFDQIIATERAAQCREPTPPRKQFPVDQEIQSLQAEEHDFSAGDPSESVALKQPSHEASMEEIIENGKRWMCDEVMTCFKKYAERRSRLKILESHLVELCCQCFNVEDYNKNFHHYNFKVKIRKSDSVEWTVRLYFAEVKEIFGRKYYFCCPLEPNENGHCHACMNQGVEDLKHPATGGYEIVMAVVHNRGKHHREDGRVESAIRDGRFRS